MQSAQGPSLASTSDRNSSAGWPRAVSSRPLRVWVSESSCTTAARFCGQSTLSGHAGYQGRSAITSACAVALTANRMYSQIVRGVQ